MGADPARVRKAAEAWLADDPDPGTRAELRQLLDRDGAAAESELADRFAGELEFGTAGLRGELGAGPNRMNRVVVIRAAAGLAAYLAAGGHNAGQGAPVVIGYDARRKSDEFARDTAAVMAGAGFRPLLLPRPLPTPVLAFAIRHLGACAGVMVTASHNPPRDNGYKVYLGDGSQITPPADGEIAAAIRAVGPVADLPRGDWTVLDDSVLDAYLDRAAAVPAPGGPRTLRVVSTALHGVGGAVLGAAFERAGFAAPIPVPEQQDPDPDFPTVAFPNPEEPGVMDLALALAGRENADLVIANDPDADRCAVAVPTGDGGWRMLRGDEVGALLGAHVAERLAKRDATGIFATTIVSSSQLGAIATAHGLGYRETLTGFKWLSRVPGLTYAYEEALGYCVDPDGVRDKDGITAALLVAELAAWLRSTGRTLLDELDILARRLGVYATDQLSMRVSDLSLIGRAMHRLRSDPPHELAGLEVAAVTDLRQGTRGLPPTDGLRLDLSGGARVVVRPSGTEPKLKCYLEVVVAVAGDDVMPARAQAARTLAALRTSLAEALGFA